MGEFMGSVHNLRSAKNKKQKTFSLLKQLVTLRMTRNGKSPSKNAPPHAIQGTTNGTRTTTTSTMR